MVVSNKVPSVAKRRVLYVGGGCVKCANYRPISVCLDGGAVANPVVYGKIPALEYRETMRDRCSEIRNDELGWWWSRWGLATSTTHREAVDQRASGGKESVHGNRERRGKKGDCAGSKRTVSKLVEANTTAKHEHEATG